MDLRKIIQELEIEKQRVDEAISALEKLTDGNARRTSPLPKIESSSKTGQEHTAASEC